jgi:hypothetical protein
MVPTAVFGCAIVFAGVFTLASSSGRRPSLLSESDGPRHRAVHPVGGGGGNTATAITATPRRAIGHPIRGDGASIASRKRSFTSPLSPARPLSAGYILIAAGRRRSRSDLSVDLDRGMGGSDDEL